MNRPHLHSLAPDSGVAATSAPLQAMDAHGSQAAITMQPILTALAMDSAVVTGRAVYLSPLITEFIRFENLWWLAYDGLWLSIHDVELIDLLTAQQLRFCK